MLNSEVKILSQLVSILLVIVLIFFLSIINNKFVDYSNQLREKEYSLHQIENKKIFMKDDIAFTIFAEDRSSEKAMEYIASVIYNRAKEKTLEEFHSVVLKPYQFSCWKNGNRIEQTFNKKDLERYEYAKKIVDKMLDGEFVPVTVATHYHNGRKVKPNWSLHQSFKLVENFNDHSFYILVL